MDKDRKYLWKYVDKYPSISAAAKAWGVSRNGLWLVLEGQRGIGMSMYQRLCEAIPGIDSGRLSAIKRVK